MPQIVLIEVTAVMANTLFQQCSIYVQTSLPNTAALTDRSKETHTYIKAPLSRGCWILDLETIS